MDVKEFKRIVENFLILKDFIKKSGSYYLIHENLIIMVGLQKSNYSTSYYINIGYKFIGNGKNIDYPKLAESDIRARFSNEIEEKITDLYEVDKIDDRNLILSLDFNFEKYIKDIKSIIDIKELLRKNPIILYQTTLDAKKFLEIKE